MKCRDALESAAVACVECGTRIGQTIDSGDGVSTAAGIPPTTRNTLSYHEDRNSRRFEASLTDNAMNGLGDVFSELFAQRGIGRTATPHGDRTLIKEEVIDHSKQLNAGQVECSPRTGEFLSQV